MNYRQRQKIVKSLKENDIFRTASTVWRVNWVTKSRLSASVANKQHSIDIIFNKDSGRPVYSFNSRDQFQEKLTKETHPEYFL